jgi:hypothetical protein
MPLMTLSVQHGHTFDEARRRLEIAVQEITSRLGTLITRVAWSTDRRHHKAEGDAPAHLSDTAAQGPWESLEMCLGWACSCSGLSSAAWSA